MKKSAPARIAVCAALLVLSASLVAQDRQPVRKAQRIEAATSARPDDKALAREAARRNAIERRTAQTLERQGFRAVKTSPPDPRVIGLDPRARPADLLHQLSTTSLTHAQLGAARRLALASKSGDVRTRALAAIGRLPGEKAQSVLVTAYPRLQSDVERLTVLTALRPEHPKDPVAQLLVGVLAGRSPKTLQQLAMSKLIQMDMLQSKTVRSSPTRTLASVIPRTLQGTLQTEYAQLSKLRFQGTRGRQLGPFTPVSDALLRIRAERIRSGYRVCRSSDSHGQVIDCTRDPRYTSPNRPGNVHEIVILPVGWEVSDHDDFAAEVHEMIANLTRGMGNAFTQRYREQILYTVDWTPGPDLESGSALYGGRLYDHPVRAGFGITSSHTAVRLHIDALLAARYPGAAAAARPQPLAVLLVFNTGGITGPFTANAALPHLIDLPYGIARLDRSKMDDTVAAHELGHAALQFVDEYSEPGLEGVRATDFDPLTALLRFEPNIASEFELIGDLLLHYDIRLSEILADNGSDNVSLRRRFPATVNTPNQTPNEYEREGGMFFGLGTFRDGADNLMETQMSTAHSPAQLEVLRQLFETPSAARANDRLRAAGPLNEWLPIFGSDVRLLLFDADKHHRTHPTTRYEVEIGYYELEWRLCATAPSFLCSRSVWRSFSRFTTPSRQEVDLRDTLISGLAPLVQPVLCEMGLDQAAQVNFCALAPVELAQTSLPSLKWPLPYEDVTVTTPNVATQYHWRFRTENGTHRSGYTGWSSFVRGL